MARACLSGLNRLVKPIRTLSLSAAWELGQSNLQFLRGLDKNPDPAQWHYLRERLGADIDVSLKTIPCTRCSPRTF